jgi:dihydroxyacetone kinase-like predicted kinase
VHQELSRYRYCTSFFVEGETVDPEELERELTKLGDSLLVVGGPGRSRCMSTRTSPAPPSRSRRALA